MSHKPAIHATDDWGWSPVAPNAALEAQQKQFAAILEQFGQIDGIETDLAEKEESADLRNVPTPHIHNILTIDPSGIDSQFSVIVKEDSFSIFKGTGERPEQPAFFDEFSQSREAAIESVASILEFYYGGLIDEIDAVRQSLQTQPAPSTPGLDI